jgi:hypothetical protein
MINLKGIEMEAMMRDLNGVTKQAENLVNSAMQDDVMHLMTDDQKREMRDARKTLKNINSKNMAKMSAILSKFKGK